jgi:predicted RNA-binding protein with PIN domain
LLEQYLSMPRARLIIDGYNVSKAAWPQSSLEAQRVRLLSGLAPLVARVGAETTVVFDAANVTGKRPVVNVPRGVKVLFSQEGVIADDVIRDLVAAQPPGRVVVVVSSDAEVARDIVRNGARSMAAEALVNLLLR